jgi:hypothetical protein
MAQRVVKRGVRTFDSDQTPEVARIRARTSNGFCRFQAVSGTAFFIVALTFLSLTVHAQTGDYGAAATAPLPPAAKCIFVETFGADPRGARDSAPAFQEAIDQSPALRKTVCVRPGTYRLGRAIRMKTNSDLAMARDALLIRAFHGGSGEMSGLFTSVSFNSKTNNVRISGGTITATHGGRGYDGRVFSWRGDHWTIDNVYISDWGHVGGRTEAVGGRAISFVGDYGTVTNNTILGPGCGWGCAGIMVAGGTGSFVANNDVVSGDDAYCAFPSAVPDSPVFNTAISDAVFEHNRGVSTDARVFAVGLHTQTLATTVERITVRDLVGKAANAKNTSAAIIVLNLSKNGTVRNILIDGARLTAAHDVLLGFGIKGTLTAPVTNVLIENSTFSGRCVNAALGLQNTIGATINDGRFAASTGCRYAGWADSGTKNVTVRNTVFIGSRSGF